MPGILARHIARAVLLSVILTVVLLLGLYTVIELIRESRDLAGGYGMVEMLVYIAQTTPRRFYDVFPFAALIGTLLGLGSLAATNELVVMRAAGYDRHHILLAVMGTIAVCLLVLVLISEMLVPPLESHAASQREQARSGQVHLGRGGGMWVRDGALMVRVANALWVAEDELEFADVVIYRLDPEMRPVTVIEAERARHAGAAWRLEEVSERPLDEAGPTRQHARLELQSGLDPELFAAAVSRPRLLPMSDLRAMIAFLRDNELDAARYLQALWGRIYYPFNVLVMVLVGLPFVFRGGRHGNRGLNLFAGVSLGLLFFVLSRLSQGLALLWPLPLWLTGLMPTVLIGLLAVFLLRRY